MNTLFRYHNMFFYFHFICLTTAVWLGLFSMGSSAESLGSAQILFLVSAAIISLCLLRLLDCVDTLRVVPKQSDILIMTAAFFVGALTSEFILRFVIGKSPFDFADPTLAKGALLAISTFCAYGFVAPSRAEGYERKLKIVLDLTPEQKKNIKEDLKFLGPDNNLCCLSRKELNEHLDKGLFSAIALIVISREAVKQFDTEATLLRAHLAGIPIIDLQEVACKISGRVCLDNTDLASYLLGATQKTFVRRLLLRSKYLIEPFLAVFLAITLLPLAAVIALLLKLSSPGPVFYLQTRVGYQGKLFRLVKFRSMYTDAEEGGPRWAAPKDARVTPFGRFLRRSRLDELPQLWNILKGEMSFIGPRPERPEMYQALKKEVPLFSLRTLVRPGVSGWAQVCAGYAASPAESRLKLEYDLFYIQHMSLRFDMYILLKTLKVAFAGDDASRRVLSVVHQH